MLKFSLKNKHEIIAVSHNLKTPRRCLFKSALSRLTRPTGVVSIITRHPLASAVAGGTAGGLSYGWASQEPRAIASLEATATAANPEALSRASGTTVIHVHGPIHIHQAPTPPADTAALPTTAPVTSVDETTMRSMLDNLGEYANQDFLALLGILNLVLLIVLLYFIKKLNGRLPDQNSLVEVSSLKISPGIKFFLTGFATAVVLYFSVSFGIWAAGTLHDIWNTMQSIDNDEFIAALLVAGPYLLVGFLITAVSYLNNGADQ